MIISHPDLLQEAFGRPQLADRWVSEIMDTLSSGNDLVLARSNSEMMFRAVFGRDEDDSGEFIKQRELLLEHVNWIFAKIFLA